MEDDSRAGAQAIESDSVPPRHEATCVCQRCGAMIDVECHYTNGGKILVVEPRRDVRLALVHKPEALDGARACGGCMSLMRPSGARTPQSITQDEPLPYVEDAETRRLRDLVDLLDSGDLPKGYVRLYRMRAANKTHDEIARARGVDRSVVSKALSLGDATIFAYAVKTNANISDFHRAIVGNEEVGTGDGDFARIASGAYRRSLVRSPLPLER